MIVKTNFPDYLMHYGVSINDGAPGVGTGNWRRGGSDGGNPITKAITKFKNNIDDTRRKKKELRVSKIVNTSRKMAEMKANNLAKALLNVDKNNPSRKEVDKLIEIGRKLNELDDEKDDLLMKYLENEEQIEKDAAKEAEIANNSDDSYGNNWDAGDFSDTDYAAGVMFDKYEAKRNPKLMKINDQIKENEKDFKSQLIEALRSNTGSLKKEFNSFKPGETGTKEFDRMFIAVTLGQIKSRISSEKRMQEVEEKRVKEANDKPLTASDQELAVGDENSVREYKRYESDHPGMSSYDHTSDDGLTHLTVFSKYNASKKEETMPSRNELEKANETFDKVVKNKDEIKKAIIDSIDDRGYLKEWAKDKNDNPLSRQEVEKSLKQFYASADPNDDMNTVTVDFSIPNGDFDWLGGHGFTAEVYFDKDGKPKVYYPRIEG